jgi:hypothetical protein
MPIKVMAAPKDTMKLLQAGLEKHLGPGMVDATLAGVEGLGSPYRVFHLGLDALVSGKPIITAAKHVGWRADLVDRKKNAVAGAELAVTRGGLRFASINRGPHIAGSRETEAVAERWSRQAKGDYEFALLRVPGAYCTALWLRSEDGTKDAFVPIAPCPAGLSPNTVYREREFRAALMPEARKQLDSPRVQ